MYQVHYTKKELNSVNKSFDEFLKDLEQISMLLQNKRVEKAEIHTREGCSQDENLTTVNKEMYVQEWQ